jgi:hypothetical protein
MIALADFDPLATAEDWVDTLELSDADTGGPVDLTGVSLRLEARLLTANGAGDVAVTGDQGAALGFPDGPAGGLVAISLRRPFAGRPSGRYRVTLTADSGAETLVFLSHITVINLDEAPR